MPVRITFPRVFGLLALALMIAYTFVWAPNMVDSRAAPETPGLGPIPEHQPAPKWVKERSKADPVQVFPAPGKTFLGVMTTQGSFDLGPVDDFAKAVGGQPQVMEFSVGWADSVFDRRLFDQVAQRGMMPMMAWEPWDYTKENPVEELRGDQPEYSLANILAGRFDAYVAKWAEGVKELGYPVAIRFAHEMNGYWYPWAVQANHNTPEQYVQAWRHVHDIFTRVGATDVTWVWSPNRDYTGAASLAPIYPGDEYVDWVGLSGYFGTKGVERYTSFNELFQPTVKQVRAFTRRPIVVTETGAVDFEGKKAGWITEMFEQLPQNPDIIGVIWYEARKAKQADWRVSVSRPASDAFRAGMRNPRYDVKWTLNSVALRDLSPPGAPPPAPSSPPPPAPTRTTTTPSRTPSTKATTKATTKPPAKPPTTTTRPPTRTSGGTG